MPPTSSKSPATLVSASAVGFYGSRGDESLSEQAGPGRGFLAELCGDWEAATRPAAEAGVRVVNLRIGIALAREGGALALMRRPFALGLGGRLGDGQQWVPWIQLDDLVALLRFALDEESLSGPLNAVGPAPARNAALTTALSRVLRRPALIPVPGFAIRLARYITGRKLILVFNFCYHGTVDEALITLTDGIASSRESNAGPAIDPAVTTRVVEFNDIPALEAALAPGDVACVLAEPVMTNIGIVHPEPGYHAALREITHRTETLLIMDETHTICAGPGGYTRTHGLQPDMMTLGKPIASGVPAAVYGFTAEVANRIRAATGVGDDDKFDVHGIGGTLAGNALSMAAMRVTLEQVLTQEAYDRMFPLAQRLVDGVQSAIEEYQLPWHVTRLGCRAEYWFRPTPPRNGTEANAYVDTELAGYMHLAALNRGIMLTPFHNMALVSPETTEVDIDRHTQVFRESVEALVD